jgi:hypothetical protein
MATRLGNASFRAASISDLCLDQSWSSESEALERQVERQLQEAWAAEGVLDDA